VITLLWKGIAEYMNISKTKLLIGCSSVKISSSRDAALIFYYLDQILLIEDKLSAKPQPLYQMPSFSSWLDFFDQCYSEKYELEAESLIPSLLKSYLRLGAKVAGEPAYDQDFDCVDYLTILQRDQFSKSAEKKYGIEAS
jgi:putative hemolysin